MSADQHARPIPADPHSHDQTHDKAEWEPQSSDLISVEDLGSSEAAFPCCRRGIVVIGSQTRYELTSLVLRTCLLYAGTLYSNTPGP